MKRITTLALAAAMLCGASMTAEAAEIKINGMWQMSGVYENDLRFLNNEAMDTAVGAASVAGNKSEFSVRHRLHVNVDIQNSENLRANIGFMAPIIGEWGRNTVLGDGTSGSAFAAGGGTLGIHLLRAYVDWFVPTTDVMIRMGLQPNLRPNYLDLPSNPHFNHFAPGIMVDVPVNQNVKFQAQWLRLFDSDSGLLNGVAQSYTSVNADYFTVNVPLTFKGMQITPWASYMTKASGTGVTPQTDRMNGVGDNTYWFGITSKFTMFDPFTLNFDFLYSAADSKHHDNNFGYMTTNYDGDGWLVDGSIAYRSQYGSTKLSAWYSPGADKDGNGGHFGEIIPTWTSGTAFFNQDLFAATALLPNSGGHSPNGTFGLMLGHTGFALAKNWHIGGHVMYLQGTHHKNSVNTGNTPFDPSHLTTEDSLVEFSFWTRHQIMKGLTASWEVNYMMENFDEDVWFNEAQRDAGARFEDGFRTNLTFFYTF